MLNCNKRDQKKSIYDLAEVALFSDVSFIFLVFLKLKLCVCVWGGFLFYPKQNDNWPKNAHPLHKAKNRVICSVYLYQCHYVIFQKCFISSAKHFVMFCSWKAP